MAIGEAGSLSVSSTTAGQVFSVSFGQPITDAVIAVTHTQNGGDPFTVRIVSSDDNGFSFIVEEWEYLDGAHPAVEDINWLAISEGVHTLPDGRVIEAGTTSATQNYSTVSLATEFTDPPVVLTSVSSNNDTTAVTTDIRNVSTAGTGSSFQLKLREEEAQDNIHAAETIGFIAIQGGGSAATADVSGTAGIINNINHNDSTHSLGATFTDGVVLVGQQTNNGNDTSTEVIDSQTGSTVTVHVQEEQSANSETNHINENFGVVAFEDGFIPCFTPQTWIDTPHGPRDIGTLKAGDLILTRDHGPQELKWISTTTLSKDRLRSTPNLRPILIKKNAIAPHIPNRDMYVSPQHRMLIEGWHPQLVAGTDEIFAPTIGLVNDTTICATTPKAPVTYIHLLFDQHQVIYANDAPTESLHAAQLSKTVLDEAAQHELFTLFPELRSYENAYGPTAREVIKPRLACTLLH